MRPCTSDPVQEHLDRELEIFQRELTERRREKKRARKATERQAAERRMNK